MKKLLFIFLAFTLASCQGKDLKEKLANTTWVATQVSHDGHFFSTIEKYEEILGYHFDADNTGEVFLGGETFATKYEIKGDRIVFTQNGKHVDYQMEIKKVDEKWMDAIMTNEQGTRLFYVKFLRLPE